jgi:hypothetical protein
MSDPVLVPLLDDRVSVKAVMVPGLSVRGADITPTHILIHTAKISPVIGERNNQPHAFQPGFVLLSKVTMDIVQEEHLQSSAV